MAQTPLHMQKLPEKTIQHSSATLLIENGAEYVHLTAFDSILHEIIADDDKDITIAPLLSSAQFTAQYHKISL